MVNRIAARHGLPKPALCSAEQLTVLMDAVALAGDTAAENKLARIFGGAK